MRKYHFSDQDKERIKEAVRSLETRSGGEIVPYFVPASHGYPQVRWRLAALMGLMSMLGLAIGSYFWLFPFQVQLFVASVCTIGLMAIGYFLPQLFPVIIRSMVSAEDLTWHVRSRAMNAFLEENLHHTADRVGVLIFISRLERKVIVLGDSGINAKVQEKEWQEVVDEVIKGIKQNAIADGLVNAIARCEALLLAKGFERKDDDTNELDDSLRIGE